MTVSGLQSNVQKQRVDGGQIDQSLGQLTAPLDNTLQLLNNAFSGTLAKPLLNTLNISAFSNISFADGSRLNISNGFLQFQNRAGNVIRLGASTTTVVSGGGGTTYSIFGASGTGHSTGLVPDPGSTAGTAKFLREDATWATPPTGTTYSVFGASGASHSTGLVPDPGASAGTSKYLREDSTWATPPTGTTYSVFGASGGSHSTGLVPDPGASGGTVKYLREDASWAVPPDTNTTYSVFGASGGSHASGLVPDPGATGGTTKYLREDATWATPPTGTTYSVFGASGGSHSSGLVPDPGATGGTTKFLREDATWATPSGGSSGLQPSTEGVLASSTTLTWSGSGGSGQAFTWTVPSTLNGNTVNWVVVTKVACSLLSGSPGTSATYGVTIAGTGVVGSRQLPPYGGGVNVSIVDLNVQNLSGTSKNAQATNTVVVTPGGTFSGSSTWRVDIIGYYL